MDEILAGPSAPKKARIEIIPLIDVIFFLLATFVLFTLSLQQIKTIDVTLPRGGDEGEADSTVAIQVSEEGAFYWKQGTLGVAELISAPELRPRLAQLARSVSVPRVLVRSDRAAKLGAAVMVLDEVRRAGIKQVSVETLVVKTGI